VEINSEVWPGIKFLHPGWQVDGILNANYTFDESDTNS
jgi:hypothetical protein